MTSTHWGVVGGGMLGISLALQLRDMGHQVTILEGSGQLGGLAAPWTIGDVTWDRHYHVILNSDTHLLALIDRLGLTEELRWVETRTGVFAGGELYSVSNSIEYLRFPPLNLMDKVRIGWTILYGSRIQNWKALENTPVETWLRKHSGDRAFEKFWRPLLRSKLGDNYKDTSAAFIWTTIQRLYAARRSGLKKEMFGYVEGGYARIIRHLSEELEASGVEVLLNRGAKTVRPTDGHVEVTVGEDILLFDRVVVTLAAPLASGIIPDLDPDVEDRMRKISYQGILCASMLSQQELGGFYVTNITDDWVPFTGVIEMSTLVDKAAFGGDALTYLPLYTSNDDPVMKMSDSEIQKLFVAAVTKMYPGFEEAEVTNFKVSRVSHVFPIPTLGYSDRIPPIRVARGVYAANSAHILNGTLNVNETLQLAARVLPVLTGVDDDEADALSRDVSPMPTEAVL